MTTPSRQTSRRRIGRPLTLLAAVGIIATLAQVAGVGGLRSGGHHKVVRGADIATLAAAPVPDIGSTKLASTSVRVKAGTTVRMSGRAHIATDKLGGKAKHGQGVCGIIYSRDGDRSWTLGTPYETIDLRIGKTTNTTISRSFAAPATDTYRMAMRCHIAAPAKGSKARGTGGFSVDTGLPEGAAKPRPAKAPRATKH
jgi:hypothetical protein